MLHYVFSIFDKHTEKLSLIGKCIYTDGYRGDFLFLLSGDKCNKGKTTEAFHPCGKSRKG